MLNDSEMDIDGGYGGETEDCVEAVASFLSNLSNDPHQIESVINLAREHRIGVYTRQAVHNLFLARQTELLSAIIKETYSRMPAEVPGREPEVMSAKALYWFGFEPRVGTDQRPCQNGNGVCVAESKLKRRPRIMAGAYCRFCLSRNATGLYHHHIYRDIDSPLVINNFRCVPDIDGEYSSRYMLNRKLRKQQQTCPQLRPKNLDEDEIQTPYDKQLSAGKFYGFIGAVPKCRVQVDFDCVRIQVPTIGCPDGFQELWGLQEKPECYYQNCLPSWARGTEEFDPQ